MLTYVFTANNKSGSLTTSNVVRALVLVHTPIARPVGANAVFTVNVFRAVVVSEVPRYEILVRFRGPNAQWYQYVVFVRRYVWTSRNVGRWTGQTELSYVSIYWFSRTKHTPILSTIGKFGEGSYS